ncbi:SEC-C metal-binding domain-containing protein [Aquisalimonas sp.]|uniref:IS1096 element passenger TnpR family protein n=1 Tax=Aquisalimonas sp. TaxID=1872621 RepID=UPI0025C52396|nr:SEC-C metal-binding domain-containing protein [Aquisalimonas sp.]
MKVQRNDKCPCGSEKKYKKCCYLDPAKNAEITRAASMSATWAELVELLSKPMEVYRVKVILIRMGLRGMSEEISRTFEIEGNHTLFNLHMDIQYAFDWDNDHLFSFYFGGKLFDTENEYSCSPVGDHFVSDMGAPSKSAEKTQIRDLGLAAGSTFLYLFDYGDELVHEVVVEKIRDRDDGDKKLPTVVSEIGTPPPQYGEIE